MQPCDHSLDEGGRYQFADGTGAWAWGCDAIGCLGGREVTGEDILAMAAALEPFQCGGCDEFTATTHWRSGADGALFHAGADAPPSDPSPSSNQEV